MIKQSLAGKRILITGSTGYLGKSLLEKILRAVPEVGEVVLAIRPSARRTAGQRFELEVIGSPAFRPLRESLGEEAFRRRVAERTRVLELDLGEEGLGLDEAGLEVLRSVDVVIHSAAAVEFDNPVDLSARTNLSGAARLVERLADLGASCHLVHISTAYVGGLLRGLVLEEAALDPGFNWRHEAQVLGSLRAAVEEESRRPEVLKELTQTARDRMGPAGTPSMARTVERLRERWVKDRLVERGRSHARGLGFTDVYSFTKAMAEHAVFELHGALPVSVVRPSIVESALAEPFPGWLEGFRMAEPIILAFGRATLRDFSGLPDSILDIIPVDMVVNAVLAVAANPPPSGEVAIYHATSGTRNPLRFRDIYEECKEYFGLHPLRDRHGQAIGAPTWTFPSRGELQARGKAALRAVTWAQKAVERLPIGSPATRWSDELQDHRQRLERAVNLSELYGVYTEVDAIYDSRRLDGLWASLPEADRELFPFDPRLYDWHHYFQKVHLPTVIRMSRADAGAPRGAGPSGKTRPQLDGAGIPAALTQREGRDDVVAVFDVDGTLVETNVVEYFFWMRLQDRSLKEWPSFLADMARKAPRWLYLERRSRAEFQRSFYREYDGLDEDLIRRLGREALNEVTLRRIYPEGVRRIRAHQRAGHRVLLLTGALDVIVEPLAELLQVELDCARLIRREGLLTGDLERPPAAGEARATLLGEYARERGIDLTQSFAYADALSDLPMLELVGVPVAVNPDARLSQIASQRGWKVERWKMARGNFRLPIPDPRSASYREGVRR